jgi:hypothetical protein
MICFHTADAWIRTDARAGDLWSIIRLMGGLAAPLFITLAGISMGLKTTAQLRRGEDRAVLMQASLIRGLQIVLLGYLLRLQMWMIDFGAIHHRRAWLPATLLLSAYLLAYIGLGRAKRLNYARFAGLIAISALFFSAGIYQVELYAPHRVEGILRVDILQSIGASLAVVSIVGRAFDIFKKRPYIGLFLGSLVAFATPLMRSLMPGPLPEALASYVAIWDAEPGKKAVSFFTLFPWMAYAFFGLSFGAYWERAKKNGHLALSVVSFIAMGAFVSFSCYESHPLVHHLISDYIFITQPIRVFYRVGAVLLTGGFAVLLSRPWMIGWMPFRTLGCASLLVYWVHLEFAYGVVSKPLKLTMGFSQWWWGFVTLTAVMTIVAWLRVRAASIGSWFYNYGLATFKHERS